MIERPRHRIDVNTPLYPADISIIIHRYKNILTTYNNVLGSRHVYPSVKLTTGMLSVLFPLKEHPIHGKTGLQAIEKYDANGMVRKYSYQWKIIIPKMGIHSHHISAWGNDPHDIEWTRPGYIVDSEPHHLHHVPGDWKLRQANWTVWTLEEAFEFVERYIKSGTEYRA